MRGTVTIAFLITVAFIVSSSAHKSYLSKGFREKGDIILEQRIIKKSSKILGYQEAEEIISAADEHQVITMIEAYDIENKNHAETPVIKSGGIGEYYAIVKFKSHFRQPLHYFLVIHGHPKRDEALDPNKMTD